jgi:acid phosphatase (class A)
MLSALVPERNAEFIAKADGIAQDRVIIGVHYPSDITAGKVFGDLFHAELLKSAVYREDLGKIKTFLLK